MVVVGVDEAGVGISVDVVEVVVCGRATSNAGPCKLSVAVGSATIGVTGALSVVVVRFGERIAPVVVSVTVAVDVVEVDVVAVFVVAMVSGTAVGESDNPVISSKLVSIPRTRE